MRITSTLACIFCMILSGAISAQTPVYFKYDAAGNRIRRTVNQNESASQAISSDTVLLILPKTEKPIIEKEEVISTPQVRVYPNPTHGALTVYAPGIPTSARSYIAIYDIRGKLMQQESIQGEFTSLDITSYPNGVYLLRLVSDKQSVVNKVIKQ